jgi:hypothetical protein
MAELYKELRDRTESGSHLAAKAHRLGVAPENGGDGGGAPPEKRPEPQEAAGRGKSASSEDPLVQAAFALMDSVDQEGSITVDALPPRTASDCTLSIDSVASDDFDGGLSRCLVAAPTSGRPQFESPRGRR